MLAFEGTNNGPTTYGGGGTKPESRWSWGMPVLRRRLTTVAEYYNIASLSVTVMLFHMQFFALLDSASSSVVFLRDCVNQGWPAASACAVDTAIAEHLEACGVASAALPRRQDCDADDAGSDTEDSGGYGTCNDADPSDSASDDDGHQRTGQLSRLSRARGAAALHREVGSGNPVSHSSIPTATASEQVLAAADTRDWTAPLHPNTKNQRRTLAGPMSSMEWAQMHFLMGVLNAAELETGTTLVYSRAVMHFIDFLTRYSLGDAFTIAHRATKAVFTAVRSSAQVEQMLLHFVLHELAVRGTFGKQRCKAGGDVRANFAADHKLCVVKALGV